MVHPEKKREKNVQNLGGVESYLQLPSPAIWSRVRVRRLGILETEVPPGSGTAHRLRREPGLPVPGPPANGPRHDLADFLGEHALECLRPRIPVISKHEITHTHTRPLRFVRGSWGTSSSICSSPLENYTKHRFPLNPIGQDKTYSFST